MLAFMFLMIGSRTLFAEPEVLWSSVSTGGVYSSIGIGDQDGDGVTDVACGVNFWDQEPTLWAVSGATGDTLWTSSSFNGIYGNKGLTAFPDVNGDGRMEILMATPGGYAPPGRSLLLISGFDGSAIWSWAACEIMPANTGWGYCSIKADDLNGDGVPEAVAGFGTSGSSNTGLLVCLNGSTGDSLWTSWVTDAVMDAQLFADVDSDGVMDVLAAVGGNGYTSQTARLYSGATGELLWQNDPGGDCASVSLLERPDTWPLAVFSTTGGNVVCYDGGGTPMWSYEASGMFLEVIGGPDVNGDGTGDAAVAADNAGVLCLSGDDGSVIWSYPSGASTWSVAWVDPVIIQGVPIPCVAAGSVNGRSVTLINALTGEPVWEMPFTERVYDVSAIDLYYESPVVVAGLQDQQPLPHHAWSLASSTETGIEEGEHSDFLFAVNPSYGAVRFSVHSAGSAGVEAAIYDVTGRLVFTGNFAGDGTTHSSPELGRGVYFLRARTGDSLSVKRITVL
jgi:outer membrane protein assembly factor BamB